MSIRARRDSLLKSSISIKSMRDSVAAFNKGLQLAKKNAAEIVKNTKESNIFKRSLISRDNNFFRKRQENIRRKDREDEIEAVSLSGAVKRRGTILAKSTRGFLGRMLDFVGILLIGWALINLPISLSAVFKEKSSSSVRLITILVNLLITLQLLFRWSISGHFPISNLYESLYFLTWGITLGQLLVEREYQAPIIPSIAIPIELLTVAFACFVLPEDLKLSSNLVPALRSSWLVMHVSVVMLSYAALIIGSLLSMSVLFINKNKPLQIRSSSTGIGGFKLSNSYPVNDLVEPIEFSHSEELDTLSYRSILVGFVLLTLGLISGAVWANEAWGTWWSWDPKETWAFISWLFYAAYLHMRISKGWQGRRPALLATTGFLVVLICYLGVNFLGIGLHSYGWIFG